MLFRSDGSRACIIALTGWGGADDVERALAAGFDRHMVKPIDPRILEKLVQELPLPVR